MNQEIRRPQAILLLMVTAIIWSTSGLFVKVIDWGPMAILSGRSLLAAGVLFIYLRRPVWTITRWRLAGALAFIGTQLFFIAGTKLTTAANVIFLSFTSPVYIALFSFWLIGERPRRADWVSMVLIFVGMGFFFGDDLSLEGSTGNLLGVLSGISMAVMAIAMRKEKADSPGSVILMGNLIAALIGLPWLLQASFTPNNISIILFLGLIQIGLTFVLYSIAIQRVEALEATLITTLEPVLNPLWVFLAIGEVPGQWAFVGGALVLVAVVGRAVAGARQENGEIGVG